MSWMPRSLDLRLDDIRRAANKLDSIVQDKEAFLNDSILQDAAAYNLLAIGEACSHLPEELKETLPKKQEALDKAMQFIDDYEENIKQKQKEEDMGQN